MITYKLEDHTWFERLYLLKEKWCTGLNKNYFSAGILSSQRSESTNSAIESKAKKTTNLTEFFKIFTETIQRWRENEKNDEFQCSRVAPTSVLSMSGIVKHASQVYTLTLFKDFEKKMLRSVSMGCKKRSDDAYNSILYIVTDDDNNESYEVVFCELDGLVTCCCSCKRFEECGLLCSHILKVFQIHSIREIPACYINKRWTKVAKMHLWDKLQDGVIKSHGVDDLIPWRHRMARKYYNLIKEAEESEIARHIIEDGYDRDALALKTSLKVVNSMDSMETGGSTSNIAILNPTSSVTKGRKRRIKGALQDKKKNKNMIVHTSNQSNEFGSKTPNPRLF